MMFKPTQAELEEILKAHQLWLGSEGKEGEWADLEGADLTGADFIGANLEGAHIEFSDVEGAIKTVNGDKVPYTEADFKKAVGA